MIKYLYQHTKPLEFYFKQQQTEERQKNSIEMDNSSRRE